MSLKTGDPIHELQEIHGDRALFIFREIWEEFGSLDPQITPPNHPRAPTSPSQSD